MSMLVSFSSRMVTEAATLEGQLPELAERVQYFERIQTLVRVLRTTQTGALIAAPHPDSRTTWIPLGKVQLDRSLGGDTAPWPLQFCRMPAWLYRRVRLELLPPIRPAA